MSSSDLPFTLLAPSSMLLFPSLLLLCCCFPPSCSHAAVFLPLTPMLLFPSLLLLFCNAPGCHQTPLCTPTDAYKSPPPFLQCTRAPSSPIASPLLPKNLLPHASPSPYSLLIPITFPSPLLQCARAPSSPGLAPISMARSSTSIVASLCECRVGQAGRCQPERLCGGSSVRAGVRVLHEGMSQR